MCETIYVHLFFFLSTCHVISCNASNKDYFIYYYYYYYIILYHKINILNIGEYLVPLSRFTAVVSDVPSHRREKEKHKDVLERFHIRREKKENKVDVLERSNCRRDQEISPDTSSEKSPDSKVTLHLIISQLFRAYRGTLALLSVLEPGILYDTLSCVGKHRFERPR